MHALLQLVVVLVSASLSPYLVPFGDLVEADDHRCVGDDDQSIYGWRGAEVGNILRFEKDFPGATIVRLERNYRSTPHILAAASHLISHNEGRLGKTLWTEMKEGERIAVRGVWDGEAEARLVADDIEMWVSDKRRKHAECAVLVRAGHTEAGCDLARLAGLEPAAMIVEILNEDGTMSRRPDLEKFAAKHGIKIGTIADLIEYRNLNETTIEQVASCQLPTEVGEFKLVTFKDTIDNQIHFALVKGDISADEPTLVRVHLHDTFSDLLMADRAANRSFPLHTAMARIAKDGGVLVLLGKHESTDELIRTVQAFEAEDKGEKPRSAPWKGTSRNVGVGSQILASLGVKKMRLLSQPKKYHALSGFGLEVVDYVSE